MTTWDEIVRSNAANVLNSALRILGNIDDAEDVTQEVFVEAFERWKSCDSHQWAGLLRKAAVYRSLDFLRRKKPIVFLENERIFSADGEPGQIAIANELENGIRTQLSRLPRRDAQVFCLHYFENLTHEEISIELLISRSAVATALSKARTRLKVYLVKYLAQEARK